MINIKAMIIIIIMLIVFGSSMSGHSNIIQIFYMERNIKQKNKNTFVYILKQTKELIQLLLKRK